MTVTQTIELADQAATAELAGRIAKAIEPGDVLLLSGELGAGKTTLVRTLAEAMGAAAGSANSPSYVIAQEYACNNGLRLVHIDAYRLDADSELELIGWDQLVTPDAAVAIEWPEKLADHDAASGTIASERRLHITLTHTGQTGRRAAIVAGSAWTDRLDAVMGSVIDSGPPTKCPITGAMVPRSSPTWPFANEKARMADLYQWMSEGYTASRPIEERDLDEV